MAKPQLSKQEPRVEYVKIENIQRAERNPKRHDIAAIQASIRRFKDSRLSCR
jgi:hypothetical protein